MTTRQLWVLLLALSGCGRVSSSADAGGAVEDAGDEIDAADSDVIDERCDEGMAYVPEGSYTLDNKPGEVDVEAFCMDITHVTAGAYADCDSCTAANTSAQCNTDIESREDDPANCVDLAQAEFYCESVGKRVPTEEEWEWAARGGEEGNQWAWGDEEPTDSDDPARLCWFAGRVNQPFPDRPSATCPVGFHEQEADHPFGLEDMSGNVWTWTTSIGTNADNRVVRGGGWDNDDPDRMSTGFRNDLIPQSTRHQALGFRCVEEPNL